MPLATAIYDGVRYEIAKNEKDDFFMVKLSCPKCKEIIVTRVPEKLIESLSEEGSKFQRNKPSQQER